MFHPYDPGSTPSDEITDREVPFDKTQRATPKSVLTAEVGPRARMIDAFMGRGRGFQPLL